AGAPGLDHGDQLTRLAGGDPAVRRLQHFQIDAIHELPLRLCRPSGLHQVDFNCSRIGKARMRLTVAAKSALHSAGAIGGVAGSPTPPSGTLKSCGTICTWMSRGAAYERITS